MSDGRKYYRKMPWRAEPMVLVTKLAHRLQLPDWVVVGMLEWLWMYKEQSSDLINDEEFGLMFGGPSSPIAHGAGMVDGAGLNACWEQLVNHGVLAPDKSGGASIRDWRE